MSPTIVALTVLFLLTVFGLPAIDRTLSWTKKARDAKIKREWHDMVANTRDSVNSIDDRDWRFWLRAHLWLAASEDPLQVLLHWADYQERTKL